MGEAFDYVQHHVDEAARHSVDARGKRVLVVGCNEGREVSLFLDAGAREVWGIDIIDEVGSGYPREHAHYVRMSAEAMDFDDDMFDIVFCLATMEHISRPGAALSEISRVTAPEGFIYVLSSPLWHSRYGHHKGDVFDGDRYPWIHLRFEPETLNRMCATGAIEYPESVEDVDADIEYMMSSEHFNKRPARNYVLLCSELKDVFIERNDLDLEPESVLQLLEDGERAGLVDRHGDSIELRAVTHTLVGWKVRRPRRIRARRIAASIPGRRWRARSHDSMRNS